MRAEEVAVTADTAVELHFAAPAPPISGMRTDDKREQHFFKREWRQDRIVRPQTFLGDSCIAREASQVPRSRLWGM
jgi:hypothetical protein